MPPHWIMMPVSAYLDMAEMQAMRKMPMTMADWEARLSGFLTLWDREILQDAGKVSAEIAKAHAETEFEKYRNVDKDEIEDANWFDISLLKDLSHPDIIDGFKLPRYDSIARRLVNDWIKRHE